MDHQTKIERFTDNKSSMLKPLAIGLLYAGAKVAAIIAVSHLAKACETEEGSVSGGAFAQKNHVEKHMMINHDQTMQNDTRHFILKL